MKTLRRIQQRVAGRAAIFSMAFSIMQSKRYERSLNPQ
jgi:hypothetical protein